MQQQQERAQTAPAEQGPGSFRGVTLGDALLRAAERAPDATALVTPDGRWTYGDLAAEARRVAAGLIGLGVRRGDHVGVLLQNGFTCLAATIGTALAGAAVVPINARFRVRDMGYVVANADLVAVITSDEADDYLDFAALLAEAVGGVPPDGEPGALHLPAAPALRSLVVLGGKRVPGWIDAAAFAAAADRVDPATVAEREADTDADDRAMVLYTSGTTSSPRGCLISHRAVVGNWGAVGAGLRLTPDDRVWNPCPMFHIAAIGVALAALLHGSSIVTTRFFEPGESVALLRRTRPTVLYPAYANITLAVLTHPDYAPDVLDAARAALVVGAPDTLRQLQAQLGDAVLVSTYGMTESCGCSTVQHLDAPLEDRCGTAGPPSPALQARIVDPETLDVLGVDEPGEIQVRGSVLCDGYYRDPAKTAETFLPDGWMRTGDLGTIDARGQLSYRGRIKDMLKVGGENVSPLELEAHLMTHPGVLMAQVVGIPDPVLDEVPAAFVERRPGAAVTEDELLAHCRGAIARYKLPRAVRFVTEWPMSATKVKKFELRDALLAELGDAAGTDDRSAARVAAAGTSTPNPTPGD